MRCEDVGDLLPELAEGGLREAGAAEVHLTSCRRCSRELEWYRLLLRELSDLREVTEAPPAAFLDRVLDEVRGIGEVAEWRGLGRIHRLAEDRRVVFSVGGAVVGATAIGLIWWRAARRSTGVAGSTRSA